MTDWEVIEQHVQNMEEAPFLIVGYNPGSI
jgi:precorrin-3B methylase